MAQRVAVITDSTCYLPARWAADLGIDIVPVQVIVAGQAFDETEDAQAQRVADALRDWHPVTTSRPSPIENSTACDAKARSGTPPSRSTLT